jgi:hypothetical protein
MKLNLAIDAAKRAAAKEIIPFYHISHMRQDKDQSGLLVLKLLLK